MCSVESSGASLLLILIAEKLHVGLIWLSETIWHYLKLYEPATMRNKQVLYCIYISLHSYEHEHLV